MIDFQIQITKKNLLDLANRIRKYENFAFLGYYCFILDKEKKLSILNRIYSGEAIELSAKFSYFQILADPNNELNLDYGTALFDYFSLKLYNLFYLIALKDFFDEGKDYNYIKRNPKITRDHCNRYITRYIPEPVHRWRHKVAAHYNAAQPSKNDKMTTIINSINQYPLFDGPLYKVNSVWFGSEEDEKPDLPAWSVTETFENLKEHWPDARLDKLFYDFYDENLKKTSNGNEVKAIIKLF